MVISGICSCCICDRPGFGSHRTQSVRVFEMAIMLTQLRMKLLQDILMWKTTTMVVFQDVDGEYYTRNNRMLYVFRVAEYRGHFDKFPVFLTRKGPIDFRKCSTKNGGVTVRVRNFARTLDHFNYAHWSLWSREELDKLSYYSKSLTKILKPCSTSSHVDEMSCRFLF